MKKNDEKFNDEFVPVFDDYIISEFLIMWLRREIDELINERVVEDLRNINKQKGHGHA